MSENHQIFLPMEATPQAPSSLEETPQNLPCVQTQRATPVEATQQVKLEGNQRGGRRKKPMQRIHSDVDRLITFSKRRMGIYKKAAEISTLCGADVGILILSPAGKLYAYGVPNIESIADRFLRGLDLEAQNHNLSRIVMEAQRRANVGKLNKDYDELSLYLQNLRKEGDSLMDLKKQTFNNGRWWDIPVEDLNADDIEKITLEMEEIKKNSSKRLRELRVGASSSSAVVQPEDIQIGRNLGFGYLGDGGSGDSTVGGSSSAAASVQGGNMQMARNLGQSYGGGAGGSGGFDDWRAVSSAVGVQGGGFSAYGNGGIGGYGGGADGLDDWGVFYSVQAGCLKIGRTGGNGYGGCFGGFMVGGSAAASVASGGISQRRPVRSAVQPSGGSILMSENAAFGNFGGGAGGGLGDFLVAGLPTMQMSGNRGFGCNDSTAGGGLGSWGASGASSSSLQPNPMQMGGIGGFGGGATGKFGGGGGGKFGDRLS